MGHYTGPKGRINRRLGAMIFESSGAVRASERRDFPPGMAQRRRKVSNYGLALAEKQKIKYYYGLRDKQLRRYFAKARRLKGNTGEQLLVLCERRLDNVIRRAGFTLTRPQARQGAGHAHFQLNGKTVRMTSILVEPGDVVTIRNRPNLRMLYSGIIESSVVPQADWIVFDQQTLEATGTSLPSIEDVSLAVDMGQVVAFLSR